MDNQEQRICKFCKNTEFRVQAVKNTTKKRWIKFIIKLFVFMIPIFILGYINRDYSVIEGVLVGLFISIPITIVVSIIINIIMKFIPDPYDTIFICQRCGNQQKK